MKHFDDLTEINCPFGELDDDTKSRLFLHWFNGGGIEQGFHSGIGSRMYYYSTQSGLSWGEFNSYRAAKEPEIPDSIEWSHVHPDFKHLRREPGGDIYFYSIAPSLNKAFKQWVSVAGRCEKGGAFASYKKGSMEWDKMICDRPEGV